jgi:hypothetical protein
MTGARNTGTSSTRDVVLSRNIGWNFIRGGGSVFVECIVLLMLGHLTVFLMR